MAATLKNMAARASIMGVSCVRTPSGSCRRQLFMTEVPMNDEWKTADAVMSFARQGPLFHKCVGQVQDTSQLPSAKEWVEKGSFLRSSLKADSDRMLQQSSVASRVFHFYLPVYFWLRWLLRYRRQKPSSYVIGINAPQGAGKTTLVQHLEYLFELDGIRSVVLSIDDFYVTNEEQKKVARRHEGNPLLQFRGNAGTHDIRLGSETLQKCRHAKAGERIELPSYDKSLCSGRGDRLEQGKWKAVDGPIDIILFEGWMLGFRPLPPGDSRLEEHWGLKQVNDYLHRYEEWHRQIDAWAVLEVKDVNIVYEWRLQAEQRMREVKGPGGSMSDEDVHDFVSKFLPSYKAFLRHSLYESAQIIGEDGNPKPTLRIKIDSQRNPIA